MRRLIIPCFLVSILVTPIFVRGETWQIDPDHSLFQFQVRYMAVSNVKGRFNKVTGVATMDDNNVNSLKVEIEIDAASVETGDDERDEYLQGEDFFYVAKYPTITFVSKRVAKTDENRLQVIGELTIRGITKEVSVSLEGPTPEIQDPGGMIRRGVTGSAKINRKDFGMVLNKVLDNGSVILGNDVTISLDIEMTKKQ